MACKTKYIVKLSESEVEKLNKLVKTGKVAVAKRQRAQIFLYADEGPDGHLLIRSTNSGKNGNICKHGAKNASTFSWKRLGFCSWTCKKAKGPNPKKLDAEQEAKLISLACIEAPKGHARWSLRLLSERMVAFRLCRQYLSRNSTTNTKKRRLNLGNAKNGA